MSTRTACRIEGEYHHLSYVDLLDVGDPCSADWTWQTATSDPWSARKAKCQMTARTEDVIGGGGHADDASSGSLFGGGGRIGGSGKKVWLCVWDIRPRLRTRFSQRGVDCHLQLFRFEIGEACGFSIAAPAPFVVVGPLGVAVFPRRRASHLHTLTCHPTRRPVKGMLGSIEEKEVSSAVVIHRKRPHGAEVTRVENSADLGQRHGALANRWVAFS